MNEKFFKALFDFDEVTCIGSLFKNQIISPFEAHEAGLFYSLNPLHPRVDFGHKEKDTYDYLTPRKAGINVIKFRNFLFEMDSVPLREQLKILRECSIPWTAIVYSGGKSFHAILSLEKPLGGCHTKEGIEDYKKIWTRLSLRIEHFANSFGLSHVVDQSVKDPSKFTRYPNSIRIHKDKTQNRQTLISLGTRISSSDFSDLIASCPKVFTNVLKTRNKLDVKTAEEFFEKCPEALKHELLYPIGLKPAGEYPRLYRLSCWMRDLGVNKNLCEVVLSYRVFPKLLEVGYPEYKLLTAIDHSYR